MLHDLNQQANVEVVQLKKSFNAGEAGKVFEDACLALMWPGLVLLQEKMWITIIFSSLC